ncbi:MAG: hypothetical protein ABH863_05925 [Candidatus Micrarchaeota archaeon]
MGKFVCDVCGAEKPLPKCCGNEEMKSQGPYSICTYCGIITYFPFHCGRRMTPKY